MKYLQDNTPSGRSILDIQRLLDSGALTSVEVVQFFLQRIAHYDTTPGGINALLQINPDALFIADAMDAERGAGGARGPLHGIPVLLKDNIDTSDRMPTSGGTHALRNSFALRDSFVAQQLRRAGAIILGKANLTELANSMTRGMPNGYSSWGGQVRNPYGDFDVGGSSSGSAAAVAANLASVSVGTETSGSILHPASHNSIVGIKPTVGLISRTGIIPISHSQDTAGPLARSVTDAAVLLGILTGKDEEDPATWTTDLRGQMDYTQFLQPHSLEGARLGFVRLPSYEKLDRDLMVLAERALENLAGCGAEIVDPAPLQYDEKGYRTRAMVYEFKAAMNVYLSRLRPEVPVHSLDELITYNREHAEITLKYGQRTLVEAERTRGTLTEPEYILGRAGDLKASRDEGIDSTLQEHHLDALLFVGAGGSGIAARAGYPSICVPAGYTPGGLPLGLTFTAEAYSEPTLIGLAYAFEQATGYRVPPSL